MAFKGAWPRSMLLKLTMSLQERHLCANAEITSHKQARKQFYVPWNHKPGFGLGPHCRKRVAVVRVAAIGAGPEVRFVVTAVYGVGGCTADHGRYTDEFLWTRV